MAADPSPGPASGGGDRGTFAGWLAKLSLPQLFGFAVSHGVIASIPLDGSFVDLAGWQIPGAMVPSEVVLLAQHLREILHGPGDDHGLLT